MALGSSPTPEPPTYVEKTSASPSAPSRLTKALVVNLYRLSNAVGVVGKSGEAVQPATVTRFASSMCTPTGISPPDPPMNVEYTKDVPSGVMRATNTSDEPFQV